MICAKCKTDKSIDYFGKSSHYKRRAQKKNASVAWANKFFIREIYHLAKLRTKSTGFKWEVDHIIPLQSKVVCGLHWEHNLQVIPAITNRLKGNKIVGVKYG